MDSNKRTLLKTASWETFHLVGVAGVIYLFTGEWEYASLGALIYRMGSPWILFTRKSMV